ncbi:MAG: cupin domain-containing protein [Armatimonadota bacterium]
MAELDSVMIGGREREQAVEEINEQMERWGLTLPDAEPFPLDFGLGRFRVIGETEYWIANETEHGYCGKFLFLFGGQTCPRHQHRVKHETFYVVKGTVSMRTDDGETLMQRGDTLLMPPGVDHEFSGIGPALVLEVSMPSIAGDSYFEDKRIGEDGVI